MIHSLHHLVNLTLSLPTPIISSYLPTFPPIFSNALLSIRFQNAVLLINTHISYPVNLYKIVIHDIFHSLLIRALFILFIFANVI